MLNSAAGVMFPLSMAPPIITILSIFDFIDGKVMSKSAKLVREPVLTQTIEVLYDIIVLKMLKKLSCDDGSTGDCLTFTPPSPFSP